MRIVSVIVSVSLFLTGTLHAEGEVKAPCWAAEIRKSIDAVMLGAGE